jgi:hypothetical protein
MFTVRTYAGRTADAEGGVRQSYEAYRGSPHGGGGGGGNDAVTALLQQLQVGGVLVIVISKRAKDSASD